MSTASSGEAGRAEAKGWSVVHFGVASPLVGDGRFAVTQPTKDPDEHRDYSVLHRSPKSAVVGTSDVSIWPIGSSGAARLVHCRVAVPRAVIGRAGASGEPAAVAKRVRPQARTCESWER